jgi:hypothetical protein
MDNSDIVILTGCRMPAQQMIVVWTNLSGPMMVPDVVKISLGQGNMKHPWDHHRDPEEPQASL